MDSQCEMLMELPDGVPFGGFVPALLRERGGRPSNAGSTRTMNFASFWGAIWQN